MGPASAMELYVREHPSADSYEVHLYGSLADTGLGHGTDKAIKSVTAKNVNVIFDRKKTDLPHENTLDIFSIVNGERTSLMRVMSIGGGDIEIEGRPTDPAKEVYPEKSFSEIAYECGFSSQAYFSYAFKKKMKAPPREYAKRLLERYEK